MARADGRGEQVHRAVRWLRSHFADPVSVEQLADLAGMSPSAFHQHFKTVTGLSPLRYRVQLRLQEARRLMIAGDWMRRVRASRWAMAAPPSSAVTTRALSGCHQAAMSSDCGRPAAILPQPEGKSLHGA
ncbi:AraC family transcriptional regulator [Pseudoroseomonas wenyumeiae]